MGAFSFFIRSLFLTVLFVLVLQIRWGDRSLEDVTMNFITSSAVVAPLNQTAQGAVRFVRNMWTKANRTFDTHFSRAMQDENRPGSRHLGFSFDRSEKALRQKTEHVEEAAEDAYDEAKNSGAVEKFKDTTRRVADRFRARLDETDASRAEESSAGQSQQTK